MADHNEVGFTKELRKLSGTLAQFVSVNGTDWSIKGLIDAYRNIYTVTSDTKIISKILEIQLFPKLRKFADEIGYEMILAEKQNWYPDMSFVKKSDSAVKYAVDIKTTYRYEQNKDFCNGFTLGSHGRYFRDRGSTKNIQFPYGQYDAHLVLGVIYSRVNPTGLDATEVHDISNISSITSVIKDLVFFVEEKWKISSDQSGSGNTANIGSIKYIPDLILGNGVFARLGEEIFDEYWINYGRQKVPDPKIQGEFKKLTKISEFLKFRGIDSSLANSIKSMRKDRMN